MLDANAMFKLGARALMDDRLDTAIGAFQQVVLQNDTCTPKKLGQAYILMSEACMRQRKQNLALEHSLEALRIYREAFGEAGDDSVETSVAYMSVGHIYLSKTEYERSIENYEKALAIRLAALGENHQLVVKLYKRMIDAFITMDDICRWVDYAKKLLAIECATKGEDHVDTANAYEALGLAYQSRGGPRHHGHFVKQPEEYERVAQCFEKARVIFRRAYGAMHVHTARAVVRLIRVNIAVVDEVCKGYEPTASVDVTMEVPTDAENFKPPASAYDKLVYYLEQGKLLTALKGHADAIEALRWNATKT